MYVKTRWGHSSIQVTVDTYGHLIPGQPSHLLIGSMWTKRAVRGPKTSSNKTQPRRNYPKRAKMEISPELADLIGGGGRTRTYDLRIMRPSL